VFAAKHGLDQSASGMTFDTLVRGIRPMPEGAGAPANRTSMSGGAQKETTSPEDGPRGG
jgi:hypothetical protein